MNIKRALKAPTEPVTDFASLQPHLDAHGFLYASDKEDGIRCLIHPQLGPVSQTMKPIPNKHVRNTLAQFCPEGLDGELIAMSSSGSDFEFNSTQSLIMTQMGIPRFEFRVFDWFGNIYWTYEDRKQKAIDLIYTKTGGGSGIRWLEQTKCYTVHDIEKAEESALHRGKEGLMLRSPNGWYKEGRSTLNEGYLLKVKRFTDDEAVVIGVEEEMENCNLATREVSGLQKRSKHKANLKGKGIVGKLICMWRGNKIKIGSGMTLAQKTLWWQRPELIVDHTITFKYQAHGMKDLPRAPIFKGIRYD